MGAAASAVVAVVVAAHRLFLSMALQRPWLVVAVVAVVADNSVLDNPTSTIPEPLAPHREHLVRAKAAVTEPEVVAVAVAKMVVQEVQYPAEMMVLFQVKMATVWHQEVV